MPRCFSRRRAETRPAHGSPYTAEYEMFFQENRVDEKIDLGFLYFSRQRIHEPQPESIFPEQTRRHRKK
jgi:hypothetical protein